MISTRMYKKRVLRIELELDARFGSIHIHNLARRTDRMINHYFHIPGTDRCESVLGMLKEMYAMYSEFYEKAEGFQRKYRMWFRETVDTSEMSWLLFGLEALIEDMEAE